MATTEKLPVTVTDEDGHNAYVLFGKGAETAELATDALMATVERDRWLTLYDRAKLDPPVLIWCKYRDGDPDAEFMVECSADDADRVERWWRITGLDMAEIEESHEDRDARIRAAVREGDGDRA